MSATDWAIIAAVWLIPFVLLFIKKRIDKSRSCWDEIPSEQGKIQEMKSQLNKEPQ